MSARTVSSVVSWKVYCSLKTFLSSTATSLNTDVFSYSIGDGNFFLSARLLSKCLSLFEEGLLGQSSYVDGIVFPERCTLLPEEAGSDQ